MVSATSPYKTPELHLSRSVQIQVDPLYFEERMTPEEKDAARKDYCAMIEDLALIIATCADRVWWNRDAVQHPSPEEDLNHMERSASLIINNLIALRNLKYL